MIFHVLSISSTPYHTSINVNAGYSNNAYPHLPVCVHRKWVRGDVSTFAGATLGDASARIPPAIANRTVNAAPRRRVARRPDYRERLSLSLSLSRWHPYGTPRRRGGHPRTTLGGTITGTTRRDVCNVAARFARRTTAPEWWAPQALAQRDARASILVCRARHGRFHGLHFGVAVDAAKPTSPAKGFLLWYQNHTAAPSLRPGSLKLYFLLSSSTWDQFVTTLILFDTFFI